tara:strand:- start:312 stop:524 length:213 start_codon:yes stop_codon:yes gene_type:complete
VKSRKNYINTKNNIILMKDYGITHKVDLEEREILFLVEILKKKIKDREAIAGLGQIIDKLEHPVEKPSRS